MIIVGAQKVNNFGSKVHCTGVGNADSGENVMGATALPAGASTVGDGANPNGAQIRAAFDTYGRKWNIQSEIYIKKLLTDNGKIVSFFLPLNGCSWIT